MTGATGAILIVIPALNEATHIAAVIRGLLPFARSCPARIVVADGGSVDATTFIVADIAAREPQVILLDNPLRLQSAAVNLAVQTHGAGSEWLIRIDAHAAYPADYCTVLLAEAQSSGADSVVVAMRAVGRGFWQRAIARAQNARIGNGGAAHRVAPEGRFVAHGHHALMRVGAFRAVGGYDPGFAQNEDAELDHRLRAAGHRIWLTARTQMDYLPRASPGALMKQYFRFGRGRAQTMLKHGLAPAPRQAAVIALAPAVALAAAAPLWPLLALPATAWGAACVAAGVALALTPGAAAEQVSMVPQPNSALLPPGMRDLPVTILTLPPARDIRGMAAKASDPFSGLLAGGMAGLMHLSWSAGFWAGLARAARKTPMRKWQT